MDTVVLTTLLFNAAGVVVTALVMAVAYCVPGRPRPRDWVRTDAATELPRTA
jgi:hypothetical protein